MKKQGIRDSASNRCKRHAYLCGGIKGPQRAMAEGKICGALSLCVTQNTIRIRAWAVLKRYEMRRRWALKKRTVKDVAIITRVNKWCF